MNIVLTSAGLKMPAVQGAILKLFPKSPSELKLAHIITASRVAPDVSWLDKDRTAIKECGFQATDILLEDLAPDTAFSVLNQFDIIYVQGGNTFYLLKVARDCGFEQAVRKLLQDPNKWYIGVSAGSYIACPTIEMNDWKREKDDRYGVDDLTAMNFVHFLVTVHYNREKYSELLRECLPTASHPVRVLTDDQAFLVKDDQITLLGEGREILASSIAQVGR